MPEPMRNCDRRRFLSCLGVGGAALANGIVTPRWIPRSTSRPGLDEIARTLIDCSRDAAFAETAALIRRGATYADLLGGTFLAGVREVKPQPVGFQFHCVMMVESAFQLAAASTPDQRLLPAFFNIDDFKRSQARDARGDDWQLRPRTDRATWRPRVAQRELANAFRDRDAARADRAITSLYAAKKPDELFEILWPYGSRDFTNIGHKIIYTAHAYRTLARIGWKHGLPVLRSLMLGLFDGDGTDPSIARHADNRKIASRIRKDWLPGAANPDHSFAVVRNLRAATIDSASSMIVDQIGRGVAPASIWDGYRLLAGEMLMARPGILPVHATTATNALHFAFRTTKRDATKRVLLLQCATWLVAYRDFFAGRQGGMKLGAPGIEAWRPADRASAPTRILETRAAREVLALPAARVPAFAAAIRRNVFERGTEHHMYKYAAALLEDATLCHPTVARRLLSAGVPYLTTSQRKASVYERARATLAKLPK